jgi:hypothetical protein
MRPPLPKSAHFVAGDGLLLVSTAKGPHVFDAGNGAMLWVFKAQASFDTNLLV